MPSESTYPLYPDQKIFKGGTMSKLIDSRLIGKSIKHLRLSRNWTQEYLADSAGYSIRNLRRIENDGTSSIDVVNLFAGLFEVSALDILDGDVFLFRICLCR